MVDGLGALLFVLTPILTPSIINRPPSTAPHRKNRIER
jgi:hypothetical protein